MTSTASLALDIFITHSPITSRYHKLGGPIYLGSTTAAKNSDSYYYLKAILLFAELF